jgi:hypothetical protein
MSDFTITIPATGDPTTPNTTPHKKVCWSNNSGGQVTFTTMPTCVSPSQIPPPLANGATTRDFEINSGANGSYGYTFVVANNISADPRSGTIQVGSGG